MLLKKIHKILMTPGVFIKDKMMLSNVVFKVETYGFWKIGSYWVRVEPLELDKTETDLITAAHVDIDAIPIFHVDGYNQLKDKIPFKTKLDAINYLKEYAVQENYL